MTDFILRYSDGLWRVAYAAVGLAVACWFAETRFGRGFFDLFLSEFQTWRKKSGGVWFLVEEPDHPTVIYWTRLQPDPEEAPYRVSVKTEVYDEF